MRNLFHESLRSLFRSSPPARRRTHRRYAVAAETLESRVVLTATFPADVGTVAIVSDGSDVLEGQDGSDLLIVNNGDGSDF